MRGSDSLAMNTRIIVGYRYDITRQGCTMQSETVETRATTLTLLVLLGTRVDIIRCSPLDLQYNTTVGCLWRMWLV